MKKYIRSLFTISALLFAVTCFAQDCQCLVSEVQSNTVTPCDFTVGTVITVNSVQTFQNAINQANNDGGNLTILIEDGTYQIASTASFPYLTASNVVIRSVSGNRDNVIIRGGGMASTSSTENGFLIAGNDVVIADLTIREVGNHGIQVSGHNLFVHNVKIQNTYEQMIKGSTTGESIDFATIQCSLMEYTAGIGPQWYIGGLDIHKGNAWIVSDNVFKNISSPSVAVAEHAVHFWDNSSNNTVERNLIINCDRGIGFGLGNSPNTGGIIRNNMIFNNGSGLYNDVGIGLETSLNTNVYNNTIHIEYQNAIEYRFEATSGGDIINNLTNKSIISRNGGTANLSNNVTNAEPDWYTDVSSGDLHLAPGNATVVDQGLDLAATFTDDIDKNLRPLGLGFDIGADEYMSPVGLDPDFPKVDFVNVFPNPSAGLFSVSLLNEIENVTLSVIDIHGHVIYPKFAITQEANIDLSTLPSGIYFLALRLGNEKYYRKVVKY